MSSFAQCFLDSAGKVELAARSTHGFFAAGRDSHCSIHRNTVLKLAQTYRSPLLFCDLEVRTLSMRAWGKDSPTPWARRECFLEDHQVLSEGILV